MQELQSEMECTSSTILTAQLRVYVTISHIIKITCLEIWSHFHPYCTNDTNSSKQVATCFHPGRFMYIYRDILFNERLAAGVYDIASMVSIAIKSL